MKNKITLLSFILIVMTLVVVFGYTNARYYSSALLTGDLDYIKLLGKISLYHPEWVGGYNGEEVFDVPQVPTDYTNIHYEVTNKIDEKINEVEVQYYIRVVAEDESNNIPIQYDVHEYNNPNKILNYESKVGYGPFTLSAGKEQSTQYSIRANFNSTEIEHITKTQKLKVQMVRKRIDGSIKVIDTAPLNMNYSGPKVKATFAYYLYGTAVSIGTSQTLNIDDDINIDFTDTSSLEKIGIKLPSNYIFHDVRHNINNANEYSGTATQIKIPEGYCLSGYFVEVYMSSQDVVPIHLSYYDYENYKEDAGGNRIYKEIDVNNKQTIVVDRGISIDFQNAQQRKDLGIKMPTGYSLQGINGNLISNNDKYIVKSVQIPSNNLDLEHTIEVYMIPLGYSTVELSYYDSTITSTKLISKQTLSEIGVGALIDFKDYSSLTEFGIHIPDGYEFISATSSDIDSTGASHDSFLIPSDGKSKTYRINVVLSKITSRINVPVKFYNSNGDLIRTTSVDMNGDGTYTFTTDICRTLCPELNTMTSFTIYISNQWGSTYDNVGNTSTTSSVTVDYNATYTSWTDFKLTDEGSFIYIKAWW